MGAVATIFLTFSGVWELLDLVFFLNNEKPSFASATALITRQSQMRLFPLPTMQRVEVDIVAVAVSLYVFFAVLLSKVFEATFVLVTELVLS